MALAIGSTVPACLSGHCQPGRAHTLPVHLLASSKTMGTATATQLPTKTAMSHHKDECYLSCHARCEQIWMHSTPDTRIHPDPHATHMPSPKPAAHSSSLSTAHDAAVNPARCLRADAHSWCAAPTVCCAAAMLVQGQCSSRALTGGACANVYTHHPWLVPRHGTLRNQQGSNHTGRCM